MVVSYISLLLAVTLIFRLSNSIVLDIDQACKMCGDWLVIRQFNVDFLRSFM
jgi:hypothetical protein